MALQRYDNREHASPMCEGVAEIRINLHLAREQPDNAAHESHTDTMSGQSS
jgi:hypothetical protein